MTREEANATLDMVYPVNGWPGREGQREIAAALLEALDAAGAFTPIQPIQPIHPIHPRADLAPVIIAWNAWRGVDDRNARTYAAELEDAGYLTYSGNGEYRVTDAGRAAGLK